MKTVLFATTALAAFAGAATAGSHAGITFGGDVEVGYADYFNGFYALGGIDLTGFVALENGVTVELTIGGDLYSGSGNFYWDDFPTVVITTNMLTFSAGDVDGAGFDNYSSVAGMGGTLGFEDFSDNGHFIVRFDASFGDIAVAISGNAPNDQFGGPVDSLSIGASGSFGSVSFGFGWEDGADTGVNIGTSLGSVDLDVAYQTDGTDNSIGLGFGAMLGSVDLAAYYAANTNANNKYGVTLDTTVGSVDLGAYWDGNDGGASNLGISAEYAVSDAVTIAAGYDQADSFYAAVSMSIAKGAEVGAAYSDAGNAYDTGINLWFSAEF